MRPVLIDEAHAPGGQIFRQALPGAERPARECYGLDAAAATRLHRVIPALGVAVDYRPVTLVWSLAREGERFRLAMLSSIHVTEILVDRLILATGAVDRVLPFPGWTLPGVYSLGAAQIMLKSQGVVPGRRIALVGAGPLLPLVASQYLAAGASPAVVLDATPFWPKVANLAGLLAEPATLARGLRYTAATSVRGRPIRHGIRSIRAFGEDRVTGLGFVTVDGRMHRVACDGIAASFGLRSEAQLADLADCRFTFDPIARQWQPERDPAGRCSVAGLYVAGDGAAIGGADVAALAGERAALALLADDGQAVDRERIVRLDRRLARQSGFRRALERAYPFPDHLVDAITDETVVCRCEGVTAGELRRTINERQPADVNRLKALTRLGMGRCQGRLCGHVGAELLARRPGCTIEQAGRLRGQPPVKPLPVAAALARMDAT